MLTFHLGSDTVTGRRTLVYRRTGADWKIVHLHLVGERPPLSVFQTGLRITLVVSALGLVFVRRDLVERITLLTGAAAAGSSALYGFGLRAPSLSAFRLLSHLVLYALATLVAGRMILRARQKTI